MRYKVRIEMVIDIEPEAQNPPVERPLTLDQYKGCMAITSCFEGDDPIGNYALTVVLNDSGGISYGKHQATENGGALYLVLQKYIELQGVFAPEFVPYMSQLYNGIDQTKKWALTNNEEFKALLEKAGNEDEIMRTAQDAVFNTNYYLPAIAMAERYGIYMAAGKAMAYEQTIQWGPEDLGKMWADWLDGFNPNTYTPTKDIVNTSLPMPEQNEQKTIWFINDKMYNRRAASTSAETRKTVYRSQTFTDLMIHNKWALNVDYDALVAYRSITITQEILDQLPPPPAT